MKVKSVYFRYSLSALGARHESGTYGDTHRARSKMSFNNEGEAPSYKESTSGIMTMAPIFRVPYDSRL